MNMSRREMAELAGVAPPVSRRCPWCEKLTVWFERQCQECGSTGDCHTCGERLDPEDPLDGATPTACSADCAATQAAERDADARL